MKTYAERSDRYKRNAERIEGGLGLALAAVFALIFVALIAAGAVALLSSLF